MKVRDEERMVGGGEAVGGVTKRERERNVRGGGGWGQAGSLNRRSASFASSRRGKIGAISLYYQVITVRGRNEE